MKDRVPLYPGRVTLLPVAGQPNTFDMVRADQPVEVGTPLNKGTLLSDVTAALYGLGADATPDSTFAAIAAITNAVPWIRIGGVEVPPRLDKGSKITLDRSIQELQELMIVWENSYGASFYSPDLIKFSELVHRNKYPSAPDHESVGMYISAFDAPEGAYGMIYINLIAGGKNSMGLCMSSYMAYTSPNFYRTSYFGMSPLNLQSASKTLTLNNAPVASGLINVYGRLAP